MPEIAFEQIPESNLVPLWFAEVTPGFSPVNSALKVLLIGHRNMVGFGIGDAADLTPYILSDSTAAEFFGPGSMLSSMYDTARNNAPFVELWGISVVPEDDGVQAAGSILVTTAPAKNGVLQFRIGGIPVRVLVRATDSRADLAARLKNTINKNSRLPVRATVNGTNPLRTDLTVKWGGGSGNRVSITVAEFGYNNSLFTDLLSVIQPNGGAGTNNINTAFAAVSDLEFDVFAVGFLATQTLCNEADLWMDGIAGRWSPYRQLYGHVFMTEFGDLSTLTAFGALRNGPHVSVLGVQTSPQPTWQWTAALSAVMAQHYAAPPEISRPEQTLELRGIIAPPSPVDNFDIVERQELLENGISTIRVLPDRTVVLDRVVTTYKFGPWGDPDGSWRDAVTMFQIMYFVRSMRAAITNTFPRAALTDKDTGINGFASPGQIKDCYVHNYVQLEKAGLVENAPLFAQYLVVQRNLINPNRVDTYMRADVVNQLRMVAAVVESDLQLQPIAPDNLAA